MAQAALADDVFIAVLKRLTRENRWVSVKPGANYAPAKLQGAEAKKANVRKDALTAAMLRLFERNVIWNLAYGKPSR